VCELALCAVRKLASEKRQGLKIIKNRGENINEEKIFLF